MNALTPADDPALFAEVYAELKQRAHSLRRGQPEHTLDTTALVHESFLKLVASRARVHDRSHLFRLAALAMRQVLVDALRERQTEKRGGPWQRVVLTDLELPGDDPAPGLSMVLQSLERLQHVDERLADVFSLRTFGGLPFEEIGELLGVSRATAQRDFEAARAYLLTCIQE